MNRIASLPFICIVVLLFCTCKNKTEYSNNPPYSTSNTNQSILEVNESSVDSIDITSHLQVFYGNAGTGQKKQWRNYDASAFKELSNSDGTCWLKFTMRCNSSGGYKGLLSFTDLDKVLVYDSTGKIEKAGKLVPLKEWSYSTDNHCIMITIDQLQTKTYYIKCYKRASSIRHPIKFFLRSEQNENNFQLYEIRSRMIDTVFLFFYLGFLFFGFIYFFIQSFYRSKEKILLLTYSLYIFFTLLYSFRDIDKHYFLQTTFPVFNGTYIWGEGMFSYLSYIFYMLFVVYLLDLNDKSKWAYRLIMFVNGIMLFLLTVDIVMRLSGNDEIALSVFKKSRMLLFPLVFLYFYLLIPLRKKLDKRNSYYKYFIIGSVFLMLGTGINLLVLLIRHIPSFFLHDAISSKYGFWGNTVNYTRLGVLLEIVFFSLGISKKIQIGYAESVIQSLNNNYISIILHAIKNGLNKLIGLFKSQSDQSIKYIHQMDDVLNDGLEITEPKISLKEELIMAKRYLDFHLTPDQKINFEIISYDERDHDKIMIPTMLLQPFIDNCLKHAFISKENHYKEIQVNVLRHKQYVHIEIKDNGIGFGNTSSNRKSKGTKLIQNRLKFFNDLFGNNIYFETNNRRDEPGAIVTIYNLQKINV